MNSVKSRLYQGVKKLILSVAFILPILTGTTVFAGTNFQCDFVDIQYDYEQGVIYIDFVARVESYYSCGFLGLETCFSQDAMDQGTMYYYDAAGNRRLLFDIDYQGPEWRYWPGSTQNSDLLFLRKIVDGGVTRLRFVWTKIPTGQLGQNINFQMFIDWDLDNNDNQRGYEPGACYYQIPTTTIDPVQNFTASQGTCDGVQLTWTNPDTKGISYDYLTHYIYRNGESITPSGVNGTSTGFTDTSGEPGRVYAYQVKSFLRAGYRTYHEVYSKVKYGNSVNEPSIPSLDINENWCTQKVQIYWTVYDEVDLDKFVIERSTNSNFTNAVTVELGPNNNQYNDPVSSGVTYYYRLSALNRCGKGGQVTASISTNFTLDDIVFQNAYPISDGRIYLYWNSLNCYNPQEVTLEKRNLETGVVEKITLNNNAVYHIDEDPSLCVPYRYKLIVKRQDNSVYISEPTEVYVEDDISDVMVSFDASEGYYADKVILEWEANKENLIETYRIYRRPYSEAGSDFKLVKNVKDGSLSWSDENVEANQYYEYKIMAFANCVDQELESNELNAVGFRQPRGTISGQISYEGGTAVQDVKVLINSSEAGISQGTSLELDGQSVIEASLLPNTDFSRGFTVEGWVNLNRFRGKNDYYSYFFLPFESFIFSYFETVGYDQDYNVIDPETKEIWFYVGDYSSDESLQILIYNMEQDPLDLWNDGDWNHISLNYSQDSIKLYLNGQVAVRRPSVPLSDIKFDYNFGENIDGYMDEIRVWNRSLTDEETARFYKMVTSGREDGLVLNWHLDEGFGNFAFDNSQNDNGFNGNHGEIVSREATPSEARFSTLTPPDELLSRHAFTDDVGSYLINGIPYRGEGEIYRVTPVFGQHSFDPPSKTRFIGDGEFVHNDVDFTDISSFQVTGRVSYRNTDFPVEGAFIKVDGRYVVGRDNEPITSNSSGEFEVSVPIGDHYISIEKEGHVFNEAVFPGVDSLGLPLLFDFQEPITGMQFYDDTKVKLAGRMVGGTLEGDKKIGFELSENNIGSVKVRLVPVKPFSLNEGTTENSYIELANDPETGEYAMYIIPEEFSVEAITYSNYSFDDPAFKAKVDLRKALEIQTEVDSVFQELIVNGETEMRFDSVRTFGYHLRRDWIYRSPPSISVTSNGDAWLSDEIFEYKKGDVMQEISLRNENGGNLFQFPVFTQLRRYPWKIWVFEEYIHAQTNASSTVNVTDATITVANNLAEPNTPVVLGTNAQGMADYTFIGGFPNTSYDDNKPENSFTLTANIVAKTSSGQVANWPSTNEVYRAYLMGSYPTGNNFVTNGPNKVDYILRDPPGSGSYAVLEKGTTTSTTSTLTITDGLAGTEVATVKAGLELETESGTPFFSVTTKTEAEANVGVTLEHSNTFTDEKTVTSSTTFAESFATSAASSFVGAAGDVFIGRSTNIVYGLANNLSIVYPEDIPADGSKLNTEVNGLTIGVQKSLRINPSFNTFFIFSQKQIEENIIPNLKLLRNLFFVNQPDRYKLIFNDSDDEKYATNNDNPLWGNEAASPPNLYNGPSYEFIPYDYSDPDWTQDSVRFYNIQIKTGQKFWQIMNVRNYVVPPIVSIPIFHSMPELIMKEA